MSFRRHTNTLIKQLGEMRYTAQREVRVRKKILIYVLGMFQHDILGPKCSPKSFKSTYVLPQGGEVRVTESIQKK